VVVRSYRVEVQVFVDAEDEEGAFGTVEGFMAQARDHEEWSERLTFEMLPGCVSDDVRGGG
jgi:hypothetical protein